MSAQVIRPHLLDHATDFCVTCGASRMVIEDGRSLPCVALYGELAVQHLIAYRHMKDLFKEIIEDG